MYPIDIDIILTRNRMFFCVINSCRQKQSIYKPSKYHVRNIYWNYEQKKSFKFPTTNLPVTTEKQNVSLQMEVNQEKIWKINVFQKK